jgi:hypothetical protein
VTDDGIDVACTREAGSLSIDGQLLHRPAFAVLDASELWGPPKLRGSDLLIPGRAGLLPLTRRVTATDRVLRMAIDGRYKVDGTASSSDLQGVADIIDWLTTNLVLPPGTAAGTRLATYTSPDGLSSKVAPVHVLAVTPGTKVGPLWRATLDLSIPAGVFALAP